jgi:hypothetical protein
MTITQVSILLNQCDLDERIHEGMAMPTPKFVSLTLLRICDPDPSSYGSDFRNLCVIMNSLQSTARTCARLLASSPDDAWVCLLAGVVENWIQDTAERFPQTAADVPNSQLDFERSKELKMCAFVTDFMKEYDSPSLPPAGVSSISFGWLGAFLHRALFQVWSDAICDNKKLSIEFLVDCLVRRYTLPVLPVVYYVTGWTLLSAAKAAVDNRHVAVAADAIPCHLRLNRVTFSLPPT